MKVYGKNIKIFTGNSHPKLATNIANKLGIPLGRSDVSTFSDGEISVSINESVRGSEVFVVQSTCAPVNDNLMELLIMIDAFKRASATNITAVIPYFGYARQDRKAKRRDPISAKLVADLITVAGADRVLTMDLHAPQLQGFFNIPVDHLIGLPSFVDYFKEYISGNNGVSKDNFVVVAPDHGSVGRVRTLAQMLDCRLAIVDKRRQRPNESEVMFIIGDVEDKHVLLIDDMIDTAGTLCNAAEALMTKGQAKSVTAAATHAVLSGPAIDRLQKSVIQKLVLLDTIPIPKEKLIDKIEILPIAPVFARAVARIYEDKPMSAMYL